MKKKINAGDAIIEGLKEMKAHVEGKITLRTTVFHLPDNAPKIKKGDVKRIREERLGVNQSVFARVLNVQKNTIEKWEQGSHPPSGAAARLLEIADKMPEIFIHMEPRKKKKVI